MIKIAQTEGGFNRKHHRERFERWINTVAAYFKQLVSAISFSKFLLILVHKKNIIHRDIKPENVLVTDNNVVKLIDFNISEELKEDGLIRVNYSKFIGTKGYAAP